MDKIIGLIIAATVIMMTALSVMFMFSGFGEDVGGAQKTSDEVVCKFQVEQYCSGSAKISKIDQKCLETADQQCGVSESQMNHELAARSGLPVIR